VRAVFADSSYWIAVFRPQDPWKETASRARREIGAARLVTADEVLVEFLAAFSAAGPRARTEAAGFVRDILAHPSVEVAPQSRESFLHGLALHEARRDKTYSLTDCISMCLMRAKSISAVLTADEHFVQEGFTALMRRRERSR
jgi:predicted nucleic acid-binding protein